jgi:Tetratricopeptide repeat
MNCSARRDASVTRARVRSVVYSFAALLLSGSVSMARGDGMEELDDVAARVQYAFYTADARALEEVLALNDGLEVDAGLAAMRSYYAAYGRWRLAQVYAAALAVDRSGSGSRAASARAAETCASDAQAAIAADPRLAEAYAIHAVCDAFSPSAAGVPREKTACRTKSLRTAISLAPANPRVLLIEALCASERVDPGRLRDVVAAFEAAPPRTAGKPDWGHAEALTLLGDSYLTSGDPVAARDALERALVIAPDYREAQELLQTAAARPR